MARSAAVRGRGAAKEVGVEEAHCGLCGSAEGICGMYVLAGRANGEL